MAMKDAISDQGEIMTMLYFCNDAVFLESLDFKITCDKKINGEETLLINSYDIAYNQNNLSPSFVEDINLPLRIDKNSIVLKKMIDEFHRVL